MNYQIPPLRRAILAAGAVIAPAGPAVLFAAPASAAPTSTFTGGVLTINSDAGNNALVVGQTPAHIVTLNGSPVLGGTVPVADVQVVRMNGGAGDDVVSLGDGSDQFTWNPGDGNDHVDGNAGKDTLIFNGSDRTPSAPFATETLRFLSDGTRSTIIRQLFPDVPLPPEREVMSFSGFELVKAPMAGGPNDVGFDSSFSRSGVGVVRVDLGPAFDPSENRGAINEASFEGTAAADRIRISDQEHGTPAAGATVSGLAPPRQSPAPRRNSQLTATP